jgi:hypothetical protein
MEKIINSSAYLHNWGKFVTNISLFFMLKLKKLYRLTSFGMDKIKNCSLSISDTLTLPTNMGANILILQALYTHPRPDTASSLHDMPFVIQHQTHNFQQSCSHLCHQTISILGSSSTQNVLN